MACRTQFPGQGSNLGPLHWECRVLATGPPGKSLIPGLLPQPLHLLGMGRGGLLQLGPQVPQLGRQGVHGALGSMAPQTWCCGVRRGPAPASPPLTAAGLAGHRPLPAPSTALHAGPSGPCDLLTPSKCSARSSSSPLFLFSKTIHQVRKERVQRNNCSLKNPTLKFTFFF